MFLTLPLHELDDLLTSLRPLRCRAELRGHGAVISSGAGKGGRAIAIANQKRGVGKPPTTINLGAALAEAGRRVLLVDADAIVRTELENSNLAPASRSSPPWGTCGAATTRS